MGKDATEICREFHTRLNQIARELSGNLYPLARIFHPDSVKTQ